MQTITLIMIFTWGIVFACRADKDSYWHDGRADKNPYPHDSCG